MRSGFWLRSTGMLLVALTCATRFAAAQESPAEEAFVEPLVLPPDAASSAAPIPGLEPLRAADGTLNVRGTNYQDAPLLNPQDPLRPATPQAPGSDVARGIFSDSPSLYARRNAQRQSRLVSARNRAPVMIGDFFGGAVSTPATIIARQQSLTYDVPNPGAGGGLVGRTKIADNTSPMPRDRIFFNYSAFDNVPLIAGGADVNRFVPGFEKTFFDGQSSFEMRFPFASTVSSDIVADGFTSDDDVSMGNLSLIWKSIVWSCDDVVFSAGLQMTLPTADDVDVFLADGTQILSTHNQSVHLMPFLGGLYTPNDRFFTHGFVQVDADANGNSVQANGFQNRLVPIGRADDTTLLYVDAGLGYWLYRSDCGSSRLTGIAPTVEIHYNRALEDTDVLQSGVLQVGSYGQQAEVVNALIGTHLQFNRNTILTLGYAAPVGSGQDQQFDGEFRLLLNHQFGSRWCVPGPTF